MYDTWLSSYMEQFMQSALYFYGTSTAVIRGPHQHYRRYHYHSLPATIFFRGKKYKLYLQNWKTELGLWILSRRGKTRDLRVGRIGISLRAVFMNWSGGVT
eukprot:TRINITY_DN1462_c0_g1_i3.p1 TRINITY_DN1462_c0_g1~~TRINITY_DN1462_c0_g1_i3.p1  ORF type:complete len:101 (+),score=0.01 TRINITY_DN1462_c0_g1_i3:609-911(+)